MFEGTLLKREHFSEILKFEQFLQFGRDILTILTSISLSFEQYCCIGTLDKKREVPPSLSIGMNCSVQYLHKQAYLLQQGLNKDNIDCRSLYTELKRHLAHFFPASHSLHLILASLQNNVMWKGKHHNFNSFQVSSDIATLGLGQSKIEGNALTDSPRRGHPHQSQDWLLACKTKGSQESPTFKIICLPWKPDYPPGGRHALLMTSWIGLYM